MRGKAKEAEELKVDYYRAMLRDPPDESSPGAHLVWVRMMSRVLVDVYEWAPGFVTALASTARTIDVMRPYCADGAYEQSFARGLPHVLAFAEYYLASDAPQWLKDVARCELWASACRQRITAELVRPLRRVLRIRMRHGVEFAVVSHDVLETLQQLVGHADLGIARAGAILWLLRVAPVYPVLDPAPLPGIVVFLQSAGEAEMRFIPVASS